MKMRNHKSLVETKSSYLRKLTTVRRDLNEVYHFKTHDKFFTFRCKWGITNHWSRQNHHIKKKTTAHQTSMKSIISNFTMYFSYSDENGDHKSFFETKSSHLRKITTVRRDLKEVYHSKTHDKIFTFRWKWGIIIHWSETKSSHLRKITTVRWDLNEVYHFKTQDIFFTFRCKWGITNHWPRQNHHI